MLKGKVENKMHKESPTPVGRQKLMSAACP